MENVGQICTEANASLKCLPFGTIRFIYERVGAGFRAVLLQSGAMLNFCETTTTTTTTMNQAMVGQRASIDTFRRRTLGVRIVGCVCMHPHLVPPVGVWSVCVFIHRTDSVR